MSRITEGFVSRVREAERSYIVIASLVNSPSGLFSRLSHYHVLPAPRNRSGISHKTSPRVETDGLVPGLQWYRPSDRRYSGPARD